MDSGKKLKISSKELEEKSPFKLGYASSLNFAQGKTVDKAFVLDDSRFSNYQLFYIALTRHKEDVKIYTTYAEAETLNQRVSNRAEKHNLADLDLKAEDKAELVKSLNQIGIDLNSAVIPAITDLTPAQRQGLEQVYNDFASKHALNGIEADLSKSSTLPLTQKPKVDPRPTGSNGTGNGGLRPPELPALNPQTTTTSQATEAANRATTAAAQQQQALEQQRRIAEQQRQAQQQKGKGKTGGRAL